MGTKWKSEGQAVGKFLEDRSHDSFGAVVDEYFGLVKKVVFRLVLNEEDTLDITQETFVVAYRKVHQFKGDAKFTTWLCRIAYNRALAHLRKRKANMVPLCDIPELEASSWTRPDAELRDQDMRTRINKAVAELPGELRAAIVTVVIDGTPPEEAAYILGCGKATLYGRIHRARKLLRKALESEM